MPGHENKFAVCGTLWRKAEVVFNLRRFPVFVGAEETDVEVMPRKLEVVRVAAKECDLLFRRENQPDIGVALERVEMIRPALPQGHHIRPQPGAILGFLFDLGDDLPARGKGGGGVRILRDGGIDACSDVRDGLKHIEFEIETFDLLSQSAGAKAVAQIIFLLRAELLQRIRAHVMIGDQQAVLTDKTSRPTGIEPHGRFLQVFQPDVRRVELIPLPQDRARRLVEQPHPFVRTDCQG
jgi:hypothetical protein